MMDRRRSWLPVVLLVAAGCAAGAELPVVPMPAIWHGPEEFEASRVQMRPGRVWAQVLTCVGTDRSQQVTIRLVARGRTAQGLTEVGVELNGHAMADLFMADDGRVVDSRSDKPDVLSLARKWTSSPLLGDAIYRPLRRNDPYRFTVPFEDSLGPRDLRQLQDLSGADMAITVEYLGHTDFNGQLAAAYRWSGHVESMRGWFGNVPVELSMDVRGLTYVDVVRGLLLVQDVSTLATVRTGRPGSEARAIRAQCQQRFDPSASRGF